VKWNLGDSTWEPLPNCNELEALNNYLTLNDIKNWQDLPKRVMVTSQNHNNMSRRPLKMGHEDDHIGHPREEDKPRGLPRRGGCQEHSPMEVEERLPPDNHAWMWNEALSIIYHPRGCNICMEYS